MAQKDAMWMYYRYNFGLFVAQLFTFIFFLTDDITISHIFFVSKKLDRILITMKLLCKIHRKNEYKT